MAEHILVTLENTEFLLKSSKPIPEEIRREIASLTLDFKDLIRHPNLLDPIEQKALRNIHKHADALFYVFLRVLVRRSGWPFVAVPIDIRCNP